MAFPKRDRKFLPMYYHFRRLAFPEKGRAASAKYAASAKGKAWYRAWNLTHRSERVATVIRYRERNREKVHAYQRERCKRPEVARRARMLHHRRRRTNPECKLRDALRCRIYDALRKANGKKAAHSIKLLGCSPLQFKAHLESLFLPGMTWANHSPSGWHIDHVRPLSRFNLLVPSQQFEAFNYRNTQPLWAKLNHCKHAKLDYVSPLCHRTTIRPDSPKAV